MTKFKVQKFWDYEHKNFTKRNYDKIYESYYELNFSIMKVLGAFKGETMS